MSEQRDNDVNSLSKVSPGCCAAASGERDVDFSMLADSLAMTPWERMRANDDILNFGETLRSAMQKRNAKPK
jgi:hypothetical protein